MKLSRFHGLVNDTNLLPPLLFSYCLRIFGLIPIIRRSRQSQGIANQQDDKNLNGTKKRSSNLGDLETS